nr:FAD-binding oxidoreductase [Micromonospora sp. DSM 115978]
MTSDTVSVVAASTVAAEGRLRYHPLRVRRIVRISEQVRSFVFDVPAALAEAFAYEAGQFVTVRVFLDGETHHRSYSMSSSPAVDDELR